MKPLAFLFACIAAGCEVWICMMVYADHGWPGVFKVMFLLFVLSVSKQMRRDLA